MSARSKTRYRVTDVARMTGLSVRALHHYDAIGLLRPRSRTAAGYRTYDEDELLRLQHILIGRELGLSLEQSRKSLDDPQFDRRSALVEQRRELARRVKQTKSMLRAIDVALDLIDGKKEKTVTLATSHVNPTVPPVGCLSTLKPSLQAQAAASARAPSVLASGDGGDDVDEQPSRKMRITN
ncbi:hypothetical protein BH09MYX1_BH09MYX1_26650 [soil metagenome]